MLTNKQLLKNENGQEKELTSIHEFILEKEKSYFEKIEKQIKEEALETLKYPKYQETCFNHAEFYCYQHKGGLVEVIVQKIRDCSKNTQFLKVHIKKNGGNWTAANKPINVNHSDCYAEGSNICTIFEGQYMFFFRIGNENTNKQKFFVSLYRYNFETESEKPLNVMELNMPSGLFIDAVKFITKPKMKSFTNEIDANHNTHRESLLDLYDVCFLYRNAKFNDACKFEIRSAKNLKIVKFGQEQNEEWVDIGKLTWTNYNFPCFKIEADEAK